MEKTLLQRKMMLNSVKQCLVAEGESGVLQKRVMRKGLMQKQDKIKLDSEKFRVREEMKIR